MENQDQRFRQNTAFGGKEEDQQEAANNDYETSNVREDGSRPLTTDSADPAAQEYHPLQNIHKQLNEASPSAELIQSGSSHPQQNRDHYVFPNSTEQPPQPRANGPEETRPQIQPAPHFGNGSGYDSNPRSGNDRVQQAAEASKQYLNYFLGVLAKPYQTARNVSEAHLLHGVINMIAIAILSALFFVIRLAPLHISFGTLFIKPLFLMALTLAVATLLTAGLLKITRVQSNWKKSVAQFGALLAPSAAAMLLADVSTLLTLNGLSYVLLLFAILFIIVAINVVLLSHPASHLSIGKLDGVYTLFIVNAITFYLIYTMLYSTLLSAVRALFGGIMSLF